jgi:tetratricopeptide (TPR) repeat protein
MLERAAAASPAYRPFSDFSIGILLLKQGAYEQAAGYFKRAVAADPSMAMGHYNLGLALFELGRWAEAEEALDQAVRTSGGNSDVMVSAAQILLELGRADKAMALARGVIQREPRNGLAHYTLGLVFERQGNIPQAIAQLERALECMPSSPEVTQELRRLRGGQLTR